MKKISLNDRSSGGHIGTVAILLIRSVGHSQTPYLFETNHENCGAEALWEYRKSGSFSLLSIPNEKARERLFSYVFPVS
jgi:hypothetical protein